jgi:putative IMPACT (imprinted ancient) family translation regulator
MGNPDPPLTIHTGTTITDSGSTFRGFAASVSSTQEVSEIMDMLKSKPDIAAANHLIYAYRLGDCEGNVKSQNFHSDGDYGVGLHLLRHMEGEHSLNMLCVVTRTCTVNYSHIGNRRMEHAVNVCSTAMSALSQD